MPLEIDGVTYFSAAEVAAAARISRATLWRWRRSRVVPVGHRLRGRKVIFTSAELEAVREYALRVEPIAAEPPEQLPLFRTTRR
jgi:hypothetical protein